MKGWLMGLVVAVTVMVGGDQAFASAPWAYGSYEVSTPTHYDMAGELIERY